ncbi:MAG TPA: hypothetical protein VNE63_16955 [Candidatus Acidoferrales bacterium]|nr:hypothetical protein [Candidatus Acidoferrales bacterium]
MFEGIPIEEGGEVAAPPARSTISKPVPPARTATSAVSKNVSDGVQTVSKTVGSKIRRNGKKSKAAKVAPATTSLSTTEGKSRLSLPLATVGSPLDRIQPNYAGAIVEHNERVSKNITEDGKYTIKDVLQNTNLPLPMVEAGHRWLLSKNLILAAYDFGFWRAISYVLEGATGPEAISVDAVEQALIICLALAKTNVVRRTALYQELKACKSIKKVRDYELRLQTARVMAEASLLTSVDLDQASARRYSSLRNEGKCAGCGQDYCHRNKENLCWQCEEGINGGVETD